MFPSWRETRVFLQESWELFYWSLFLPSKLQARMNAWAPKPKKDDQQPDTGFFDILLPGNEFNGRFFYQYCFSLLLLSLPLFVFTGLATGAVEWWQLSVLPVGYGVAVLFLPASWLVPLSWLLITLDRPDFFQTEIIARLSQALADANLPPISQMMLGFGSLCIGGGMTSALVYHSLEWTRPRQAKILSTVGWGISGAITVFFVFNNSWLSGMLIGVLVAFAGFLASNDFDKTTDPEEAAFVGAFVVVIFGTGVGAVVGAVVGAGVGAGVGAVVVAFVGAFVVVIFETGVGTGVGAVVVAVVGTGVVMGVGAGVAMVIAMGVATAAPWVGMALALSFGLVYSSTSIGWGGVGFLTLPFILLTVEQSPILAEATAIMVVLGYYRIAPDYLLESLIIGRTALPNLAFWSKRPRDYTPALKSLVPFSSEFAFLPLPGHGNLIARSFQSAPENTLPIFQEIQAAKAPGLKVTVQNVLPQIISDRLKSHRDFCNFIGAVVGEDIVKEVSPSLKRKFTSDQILQVVAPGLFQRVSGNTLSLAEAENEAATIAKKVSGAVFSIPRGLAVITGSASSDTIEKQMELQASGLTLITDTLQLAAKQLIQALENRNSALTQRSFESVLNSLERFKTSLPGRGFNPKGVQRWQPVIEHFQRLIELELEEIRKTSQGEVINPFAFGNPLKPATIDVFRGRTKISDRLMRLILDRNRPALVLHGPRRFGKTSFLLNIPRLLPGQLVPIYLSLQDSSTISSDTNFCNSFVRAFIKDGRLQNITFPPEPSRQDFVQDPFWTLRDWLDRALETAALELDDRWILVTLDEAEKLGEAIESGDLTPRIFDQLRDFIQHRDRLAFLFSGVQTLKELGPNWSNYFISTVPIEIGYLEPEEAEDLLRNPIEDFNFTYANGIVEEILRLTRCQPYLVQLMGWTLVNIANEQQVKHGDRPLLNDALPEALTNGTPYFDNLWKDFVAPKTHPEAKPFGQEFLFQLADYQLENAPYPKDDAEYLQPALEHMLRYKVIEELDNGTYQIQVPLVAQWIRDRAD